MPEEMTFFLTELLKKWFSTWSFPSFSSKEPLLQLLKGKGSTDHPREVGAHHTSLYPGCAEAEDGPAPTAPFQGWVQSQDEGREGKGG